MAFNPLFTVNARLIGTWRSYALVGGIFSALVVGFAASFYSQAGPGQSYGVSFGFLTAMSIVQGIFLLMVATGAVRKAVLRDFTTNMIESHRIAPMSGYKIVLGYLSGPPAQAYMLYLLSLLFGTAFAVHYAAGLGVGAQNVLFAWYAMQASLLSVTLLLMSLVLLVALASSGKTNLIGIMILFGVFGGTFALPYIPGLSLLLGVYSGGVLVGLLSPSIGPTSDASTFAITILFQAAFSATLLTASARKIRAPERAMFSMPLALGLAMLWAILLIVGLRIGTQNPWLTTPENARPVQIAASLLTLLVISQFALVAAAVERYQMDRAAAFGAVAPAGRRFGAAFMRVALCVVVAAAYLGMSDQAGAPRTMQRLIEAAYAPAFILFAFFLSFVADSCWIYCALVRGGRVFLTVVGLAVVLKALPPGVDLAIVIAEAVLGGGESSAAGYLTTMSPAGSVAMTMFWQSPVAVGLIVQVMVALIAARSMRRARRGLRVTPVTAVAARPAAA
ncbi:hypothetical protein RAS1_31910 [Phycisphaerae bacterium RAS1]|nr:hypothetical protein RAS1_31910 [Phycisphaerae bacterium RAS1]